MVVDVKVVMENLEVMLAMVCLGEEVPVVWLGRGGMPMVWLVELVEDFEMALLWMVLSLER